MLNTGIFPPANVSTMPTLDWLKLQPRSSKEENGFKKLSTSLPLLLQTPIFFHLPLSMSGKDNCPNPTTKFLPFLCTLKNSKKY